MFKYQFTLVLLMTSLLLVSTHPSNRVTSELRETPRRVNCWKYVFAPACRGAASKRIVSDINELASDDPDAYTDESSVVPTENRIKNVQDRLWFLEKHFEKRFRSADPEYDTILYPNRYGTN
uniref:Elevenin n=1 Tax=Carabus violaceus TaxID=41075 RepID=A0A7U3RBJ9_CARVO|nr:elevenin [Carabus violaceus]